MASSQDDDNKDSGLNTSGPCNEEPELPFQQISRKESKKQSGYLYPKESTEDLKEATTRILEALD
jgi:hypothetical protein